MTPYTESVEGNRDNRAWTKALKIYGIHHGKQRQALAVKRVRKLALTNKSLLIETAEVQTQT